ncbi:MAG: PQQ-dependent sugar dehydrogenase, partial [Planctomycetales bacterium]|nr:PQQ-dependent sugar dehydrogenase [Planctomycetales bacterium]
MICQIVICLAIHLAVGVNVHAQDSPADSLATLHPADGLQVTLWANEPMVNNPTSMAIDSRGRVWVAEGMNYRMKQKEFETLKRVEGADRIKILADTDGDGKADKVTVFADDIFPVPLGMALEEIWQDGKQTGTRLYVGNSPDLLVLEDTDGDDVADRRFALLTGFRGVDSDHGLHGMTFGPDGKLYFTVGDARYGADKVQAREATFDVTDRSGRQLSASNFGTTLRCNRDGTQLELLSSGHRNNYEACVDSFGNVFGSDNDDDGNRGCRMYWVIPGGQYGYQHPESIRHWAEEIPGIIPKLVGTGNGAPCGLTVYEGDMLPERYFGGVIQIDSGTHQINFHPLHRHGAGFRSDYQVLLKGDDDWFRPVDLSVAPDGSLYVCDWYDAGVGGNRFSDQTTGRIYRITAGVHEAKQVGFDPDNPIDAIGSPNETIRTLAHDRLIQLGSKSRPALQKLFREGRPHERSRALFVLHELSGSGRQDVLNALADSDPQIRETAVQMLADDIQSDGDAAPDRYEPILRLADDTDASVRRAVLMALRDAPTSDVGDWLIKLAGAWDGKDRYYLEAIRAALVNRDTKFTERLFRELVDQAVQSGWDDSPVAMPPYYPIGTNDAFLRPDDRLPPSNAASRIIGLAWVLQRTESLPTIQQILAANRSPFVERAAIMVLASLSDPAAGELLVQRYSDASTSRQIKGQILHQLGTGVSGPWKRLADTQTLKQLFASALDDPQLRAEAITAIGLGEIDGFAGQLMRLAGDDSVTDDVRAAAVKTLGKLRHAPTQTLAIELVQHAKGNSAGGPTTLAALDAIATLGKGESADALAKWLVDSEMPLDVRRRSLQLITATAAGAEQALTLASDEALPDDLRNELSFLLHNHADRNVRRIAAERLPADSGTDINRIHSVQSVLSLQGDAERGRDLFQNHKDAACARCHQVTGEGTLVGPDLASIGIKYGGKELMYHIQYPSGAINYNFVAYTFLMDDGQVLTGLVLDRQNGQIKLGLATGQIVTIAADAVEAESQQTVSLMPQ